MESTRIYRILSKQSRTNLNRFIKFIKSPYHNVNEKIEQLAVFLVDSIKNQTEIGSKSEIWKQIHGDSEYKDLKFRKLCNDLLERFEKFLILENLESNKILKSNLLLESIKSNELDELAEKHVSKSSRDIGRQLEQSSEFYLQKYFYEKNIQNLKSNYEIKLDLKKGLKRSYNELSESLDAFYAIEKLRLATDLQTWKKMYKSDEVVELGVPLKIIKKYKFDNYPSVEIYRLMYKLYVEESGNNTYENLKEKAFNNIHLFPAQEQKEIFDVLVSYCIKIVNQGNIEFLSETLTLYDWGIENEIILNKGKLSPTTFRNYVVAGLRVNEFERVENFIKEKAELLDDSQKENALNFNLGRLSFYKTEFENAIQYLNKVNYDDVWYGLNSRSLLLATYYELEEFNALEYQLDSFSAYLRREKSIGEAKRKSFALTVNYIKSLLKHYNNKAKIRTLKEKITADKIVNSKKWLLEKIEERL